MPQLKAYVMIGLLAVLGVIFGCTRRGNPHLKAETFVGEYIFRVGDRGAPHHDPDRLTLKADGRYILIRMPGGHPGSTEEGTWQLFSDFEPRVAFGNRMYPVEIRGKRIRLLVDDDLGYWYEKTG
jgi:hypothetical protein